MVAIKASPYWHTPATVSLKSSRAAPVTASTTKREIILPEEQLDFRPRRSIVFIMLVVRRLQELAKDTRLCMRFIDHSKAYDSVDRAPLWPVLVGVPPRMLAVIHQFHDAVRTFVRLDDIECSNVFDVEQGVR